MKTAVRKFLFGLLFLSSFLGGFSMLFAQIPDSLRPARPYANYREDALMRFSVWEKGHDLLVTPFEMSEEESRAVVSHVFDIGCQPDEQLYLYTQGLSCRVEVELNGKYIATCEHPFEPMALPLRQEWLSEQDNHLTFRLSLGTPRDYYPAQRLGLTQPVYLLTESQYHIISQPIMPIASLTARDTVGIVASYFGDAGFMFDSYMAMGALLPLQHARVRNIYFPFPPSRRFQALCAQMGFREAKYIPPATTVCWLNQYPCAPRQARRASWFWIDEQGLRTQYYGNFMPFSASVARTAIPTSDKPLLVLLVLFPLLLLMLLKMTIPSFMSIQQEILLKPALYVDNYVDSSMGFAGFGLILMGVKAIFNTISLTFVLYSIQQYQWWHILSPITAHSFLERWISVDMSLGRLFGLSFLLNTGIIAVKYMALAAIGYIFKLKNFLMGLVNIETLSAYPFIFLLPLPMALMVFSTEKWQVFCVYLCAISFGIYLLRQLYIFYTGLDKLFGFSMGMKFLYFCASIFIGYLCWM